MFNLGQKLRDRVTGFEGIATSKVEYLNGCVQFCIKPPMKDGKIVEGEYFDQQQLEFVDEGIAVEQRNTGGAMSDTPRASYRG
jgi:hypothetical protein